MTHPIPRAITDAVEALWQRRGPRPDNTFETPEFVGLKEACIASYSIGAQFWFTSSLWEILRSLGCPMLLPANKQNLALDATAATEMLDFALTATRSRVVHLCPLDWADQPPPVTFAGSRLNRFTSDELQEIVNAPRLARAFPNVSPDWDRLSEFYWLIVEEEVPISADPGARTNPIMCETTRDYGAITAHEDRFPDAVEQALFLLLLAPWEDWSEAMEVDWRGFRIPWAYTVDGDLCVRLTSPPLDSNLTWVPQIYTDAFGEPVEVEEPAHFNLSDAAAGLTDHANEERWSDLCRAAGSALFETPIRHFLVRAFHSSGIDEFIAHLTVLEAALGLQSDYGPKAVGDPRKGRKVTDIMMARVSRLLDDPGAGDEFKALFDLRSAYVHGRPMASISSVDRFRARRLARRVVVALIDQALAQHGNPPAGRESFLISLGRKS